MDIFLRGITVYHWNQFSSLKMILSRKSYLFHSILFFSISSYCELNIANHEQSFKWLGLSLREKCPNPEFFWLVFSRKIRTRKNSIFGHFPRSDSYFWNIPLFHTSQPNFRLLLLFLRFLLWVKSAVLRLIKDWYFPCGK